jgi:Fe-S-cluster-containing dehydrogenase component
MAACPYSARIFHWFKPKDDVAQLDQPYDVELNVPQKKGTISKCLFSADQLRKGELPYCVYCLSQQCVLLSAIPTRML